jgi:DNA-binding transcriptional MerR regulator
MELVKQQASSKRRLKLGDIAEHLQVKKFVIRVWEKELGLAPESGFYAAEDVEVFKKIKKLLLVDRQPLQQVRAVIDAYKLEEAILSPAEIALESMVSPEPLVRVDTIKPSVEAIELGISQIVAPEESVEIYSQSEPCDGVLAKIPVELEAYEQFGLAHSFQNEKIEAALDMAQTRPLSDSMMIAPAELCQAMTESQAMPAEQVLSHQEHQNFLAQLAFFRQELLKFQKLLNT